MDIERWFAPALELGRLVAQYPTAGPEERQKLEDQIRNCEQIKRLHHIQSYNNADFLKDVLPDEKINYILRDFFVVASTPAPTYNRKKSFKMIYHRHDYFELVFVLRGIYIQSINGVLHELHEGEVCMLNPNTIHRDEISGPDDRVIFMGLSPSFVDGDLIRFFAPYPEIAEFLHSRYGHNDQQYIRFHCADFVPVREILEKIIEEDMEKQPGHHLVIKGYLVRLFNLLMQDQNYTVCRQSKEEIEQTLFKEIQEYMYQHMNTLKRTELAEFFHFSPDYMNRFLIRNCGESYSALLTRIRMEKAAYELKQTDKSVAQIVSDLGFSNRGHFDRLFVQQYGVLPNQYRKQ